MKVALEKELLYEDEKFDEDFRVTAGTITFEDEEGNKAAEMLLTLYDLSYTDYEAGDLLTEADNISESELVCASVVP